MLSQKNPTASRREFIATFAATAMIGGKAALSEDPKTTKSFAGKIRKALKWHMINEPLSDRDKLKLILDLGYHGVETHSSLRNKTIDIDALARAAESTGIPVHGVVNSSNPDIETAIHDAKKLGATSVLHVVRYDRTKPYLQNYAETQQIIRNAIPAAEKNQVQILIENVWASFLIEPILTARYVDEIDNPWVQIYFDVGNVVRWGWPEHWLQVIGKRAKKLDIKEYDLTVAMNQGMRHGFDVPIGEGSIDWSKVRHELQGIDYRGWATAEVKGGNRTRLAEISQQMDRVLLL